MADKVMHEYTVGDDPYRYSFDAYPDYGWSVVTEAAEDYWGEHDGWEADWPLEFEVFRADESLGRFEVCVEPEPRFYASELEPNHAD